ncbi:MAG: TetR family transcriptional regulator C-terminal domain-containing protein [Oleiphilaceae bacterium]|nr:TetR family transcriptional regulator C-terminal domain-containing protein [Oleiphilaceae bacterium]
MARTDTRKHIIDIGADLIARNGFGCTGISAVLTAAAVPKGSFYHYFSSKDDFGLAVIESFAADYEIGLVAILNDDSQPPLQRLQAYFDTGLTAMRECNFSQGCLIGNLGQELAGRNELFRSRLDTVFSRWETHFEHCLAEALAQGEIAPSIDPADMASFLLAGWEGAILRAKVVKSLDPMHRFIRVFFNQCLPDSRP